MRLRGLLLATLLAVGCSGGEPVAETDVAEDVPPEVVGIAAPARPRADATELARRVEAIVTSFSGGAAIWVADAGDRRPLYARNADESVVAASLYKLGVLLHVESLVERRDLRYTDTITITDEDVTEDGSYLFPGASVTIDDALELMIVRSDNGTALAFWPTYGAAAINATLAADDLAGLRIGDAGEDNLATARAVGELLRRIAERRLISGAASDRMLGRLERQEVTGRADALLPDGVRVAHKTGDLVGLAHDAAIVFTPIGPRVVVVLTWDAPEDEAHAFIARVAQAAYETAR